MKEIWKPIKGVRKRYFVSNLGRVKSLYFKGKKRKHPFLLKGSPHFCCVYGTLEYTGVTLITKNGRRQVSVHSLVLEAFVGPRPKNFHGAHYDGNPANNNLNNLRWATASENQEDSRRHGTMVIGEMDPKAKLTEKAVLKIRKLIKLGVPQREIAGQFGVSQANISRVKRKVLWKHVS